MDDNLAHSSNDILRSNDFIKDSGTEEQISSLQGQIGELAPAELEALNDYLDAGVPPGSDPYDYFLAAGYYTWKQVAEAFMQAVGRALNLD